MHKGLLFLLIIILAGCNNQPAPQETKVETELAVKPAAPAPSPRPAASPWTTGSFPQKEGQTEERKFVKYTTEGVFSDPAHKSSYLYAEVLIDKIHAGIFLRKLKRTNPQEKLSEPVQIKMTSNSGAELNLTSTRRWNRSGGILIERNNNDYSQLRIFLLQNTGIVTVEIRESDADVYYFGINLNGFSDAFSKL